MAVLPSFEGFVWMLDQDLMLEIQRDNHMLQWYEFFDSENKPLNPREFLQFFGSLSWEDESYYMLNTPAEILRGK